MASISDFLGWKEWHGTGWMDNFFAAQKGSPILSIAAGYALDQMSGTANPSDGSPPTRRR